MKQNFIRNLFFLLLANVLVKPFWIFGIDRTVQNTVGTADYGAFFAVFNFCFLFHMLLDFGISNFNNRSIAQEPERHTVLFPTIISTKIILAVLYAGLCYAVATYKGFSPLQWDLLFWMILNQILLSFFSYFRSVFQGLHQFKTDRIFSVLDRIIMICIIGFLLVASGSISWLSLFGTDEIGNFRITWFAWAQCLAYTLVVLTSGVLVAKSAKGWSFNLDFAIIKSLLKESYPYALLGIFMSMYNRIDAVMLDYMLEDGNYQAGVYAASFRLLDAVNMIALLFATLLLPMFSRMLKNKVNIGFLTSLSARLLFIISVLVACFCSFFGAEIMSLLYTESNIAFIEVLQVLMWSLIGITSVYVFGTLLTANGNLWALNGIALSGVVLNISLNTVLIPEHSALGATWATLITQSLVSLVHIFVAVKLLNLSYKVSTLIKSVLLVPLCLLIFYGTLQLSFSWILQSLLALLVSSLVVFISGFIAPKDLAGIFALKSSSENLK